MRKALIIIEIILFLFLGVQAFGQTTYYVKNGGSDIAAGTSDETAWATIGKVNDFQSSLEPGDQVLFKRGSAFYGTLTIAKSGASGSPITYGAYGEGEDPKITSLQEPVFFSYNDTVSYAVYGTETDPNFITINGVWTPMGRYPNDNYLYFEWAEGTTKITDFQLTDSPNWTGAEVVIRKRDWVLDRNIITDHSDSIILYTISGTGGSGYTPYVNYGYFVQNDYKTLDRFGEWYYDGDTLFVYSGAEDISEYTILVPNATNLVYNYIPGGNSYDYITFENLSFEGSTRDVIYINKTAEYITIQNCNIDYAGRHGIMGDTSVHYINIINNTINHSVSSSISINASTDIVVRDNILLNTGMLLGASPRTDRVIGIYANYCDNYVIEYNRIDSAAYDGMAVRGDNSLVKNNYITNTLLLVCDGGGIYTSGTAHENRQIIGNIVGKTRGNGDGTPNPTRTWARAIYSDSGSGDITISDNTTFESEHGIFMGGGIGNRYYRNTSFDNTTSAFFIQDYFNIGAYPHSENIEVKHNKFIAKTTERTLNVSIYDDFIAPTFTVSDSNYFARPVSEGNTMWQIGYGDFAFSRWQTLSEQDVHSKVSPIALSSADDFLFIYNPTKEDSVFSLTLPYIDLEETKYVNSVTLSPYSSMVLMLDPDPDPVPGKIIKHDGKIIRHNGTLTKY